MESWLWRLLRRIGGFINSVCRRMGRKESVSEGGGLRVVEMRGWDEEVLGNLVNVLGQAPHSLIDVMGVDVMYGRYIE